MLFKVKGVWKYLCRAVDKEGKTVDFLLTEQDVDDPSQVGALLDQIEHEIGQVTAHGAKDAEATRRDTHQFMIQSLGRLDWQEACGYGTSALVETTIGRYKAIICPRRCALNWRVQRTEAVIAVAVLNRMLGAGRPNCVPTSALPA